MFVLARVVCLRTRAAAYPIFSASVLHALAAASCLEDSETWARHCVDLMAHPLGKNVTPRLGHCVRAACRTGAWLSYGIIRVGTEPLRVLHVWGAVCYWFIDKRCECIFSMNSRETAVENGPRAGLHCMISAPTWQRDACAIPANPRFNGLCGTFAWGETDQRGYRKASPSDKNGEKLSTVRNHLD